MHDALLGLTIAAVAVSRMATRPWLGWLGWLNAALGLWVLAAAFWLAESTQAAWNEAAVGALVAIVAVVAASATRSAYREHTTDEPLP